MEDKIKELEEEVTSLKQKIKKLENKDKRRKIFSIIKTSIKVVLIVVIIIFLYDLYIKVDDKYITPIKETIKNNNINISDFFQKEFK